MAMTDVAQNRETLCFIKEETVFGTAVKPAATDAVYVIGEPALPWERELLDDEQHRDTPSEVAQLAGRYPPVSFTLETYIKPSGALGTKPEAAVLLESALGTETVTGSTSVVYTLADETPSFTLWLKQGHTVFQVPGCSVDTLTAMVNGTTFGKFRFEGMGLQKIWAGTSTANGAVASSATTVNVAAGTGGRYSVGAYITLGSDTNTGAGYKITAISTDALTITPGAATGCSSGDTIAGWLPSSATEVGSPVFGKLGQATKDAASISILSAEVRCINNLKYYDEEKNNSLYVTERGRPGKRSVEIDVEAYYYKEHAKFFNDQLQRTKLDFVVPVGSTSGSICTIYAPASGGAGVEINNPDITGTEEKVIKISGKSLASSSYNDEVSIYFV